MAAVMLGGCSLVFPAGHDLDHTEQPLSDDQTRAQVVEPTKQIVTTAALQNVSGIFGWESCNDQGDTPFRGRVDVSFDPPPSVDEGAYFNQIAKTMVANGCSAGPPPGQYSFGAVIHKDGVTASIGKSDGTRKVGSVELSGECRNMGDHRPTAP